MQTPYFVFAVLMTFGFSALQVQAGATAASTSPIVPPPPPAVVIPIPAPPAQVSAIVSSIAAGLGSSLPASISSQTLALAQTVLTAALANPATLASLGLSAAEVSALLAQIESLPVRN